MSKGTINIGTSGFSYKDWLGNFYPQFCPEADFLQFYTSKFKTVEIDSTYYRIPSEKTIKRWCKVSPDNFIFSAKFPKFVTHEGEIAQRIEYADLFIKNMSLLENKLGPLLLQFPYSFKPNSKSILFELLNNLPNKGRFALELRNKKWLDESDLFELLKSKNIAFCLIDHPWMPKLKISTADFAYFRFLGDRKKIEHDFSFTRIERGKELEFWEKVMAELAAEGKDCFGYFNNHYTGHSPTTAERFRGMVS